MGHQGAGALLAGRIRIIRPSMAKLPPPPAAVPAVDDATASDLTRPGSPWSASERPGELRSSSFAHTRFDPLAEERVRLQSQAAAAFDVCHPALALRAVLLVQGVLAVVALAGAHTTAAWVARQATLSVGGLMATLLWLVVVCALRKPLGACSSAWRAAWVLACGALCAVLAWWPLAWMELPSAQAGAPFAAAGSALAGLGLAALLWAWLDLRSRIWHPANASARLAELQSRIRPHFLFNALNTAIALVRVDPARAEAVLEDLAELFRVALADVGAWVSLDEEIELARRYLEIEQIRFGDRLRVSWHIDSADPRVGRARVPPLLLQPLVENAVRHGVEPAAQGGDLSISASVQRAQVVLTVSNSVGEDPASPGHGMALHNVRERLRLLHDVAGQCDVWRESTPQGDRFHARVLLPVD